MVPSSIAQVKPACRGYRAEHMKRRAMATLVSNSRQASGLMGCYSVFLDQNVNEQTVSMCTGFRLKLFCIFYMLYL